MRNAERLREKMEVSLEGKQVTALALSALVLLAGAFAVGLLLGRKLSAAAPHEAAGDPASLDAEARKEKTAPTPVAVAPSHPAPPPAVEQAAVGEPPRPPAVIPPPRPPTVVQPAPQRPAQVAPPAPVALAPRPRDLGLFTVQVGASQDRNEAQRIESKARAAGLKPYVIEANLGAKGTWYRVRVGAFKDKDAASQFRQDVERELRSPAVVMPSR
jgi:DedD protein